jgi:hypothetical protein
LFVEAGSVGRSLFLELLHEMAHILGFSAGDFNQWISVRAGVGNVSVVTDGYGIARSFLRTPAISEFVRRRFSIVDPELVDIGLELDSVGGSHPHSRLFLTDVLQARSYCPTYVSELLFAGLSDSGWYVVNWTEAQRLLWLDAGEYSIDERLSVGAIVDPPQLGFPPSTLCTKNQSKTCFADYTWKAVCSLKKADESMNDWYNPLRLSGIGTEGDLDFAAVPIPWGGSCRDPEAAGEDSEEHAETYGPDSVCAMTNLRSSLAGNGDVPGCYRSVCRTDDRIALIVGETELLCLEEGQPLAIDGFRGRIRCPPGKVACANREKVTVINILRIDPDHGPLDGGNLVKITGRGFNQYSDLSFTVGGVPCAIWAKDDERVICRIGKNVDEKLANRYHSVKGATDGMVTEIPEMYMFTELASGAATPRGLSWIIFALVLSAAIALWS